MRLFLAASFFCPILLFAQTLHLLQSGGVQESALSVKTYLLKGGYPLSERALDKIAFEENEPQDLKIAKAFPDSVVAKNKLSSYGFLLPVDYAQMTSREMFPKKLTFHARPLNELPLTCLRAFTYHAFEDCEPLALSEQIDFKALPQAFVFQAPEEDSAFSLSFSKDQKMIQATKEESLIPLKVRALTSEGKKSQKIASPFQKKISWSQDQRQRQKLFGLSLHYDLARHLGALAQRFELVIDCSSPTKQTWLQMASRLVRALPEGTSVNLLLVGSKNQSFSNQPIALTRATKKSIDQFLSDKEWVTGSFSAYRLAEAMKVKSEEPFEGLTTFILFFDAAEKNVAKLKELFDASLPGKTRLIAPCMGHDEKSYEELCQSFCGKAIVGKSYVGLGSALVRYCKATLYPVLLDCKISPLALSGQAQWLQDQSARCHLFTGEPLEIGLLSKESRLSVDFAIQGYQGEESFLIREQVALDAALAPKGIGLFSKHHLI